MMLALDDFHIQWDRCAPWLIPALEHGGNTHGIDDVKAMVERREARFWVGRECAAVTEVYEYPRAKVFHIWLCGGDLKELTTELLPIVENWAIEQGCQQGSIIGRNGWRKIMPEYGYEPVASLYWKDLTA